MKAYLKQKSEFTKHVLTLATGTVIAQVIPLLAAPVLTRMYNPSDFGLFALYLGISGLISVIATARYELAVMLPKKDEDAYHLVILSLLIATSISIITMVAIFFFNPLITTLTKNPEISNWLYLIPFTVLLSGIFQALTYWFNRHKEYKTIAGVRISQATTINGTQILSNAVSNNGLIIGNIVGQFTSAITLSYKFFKSITAREFIGIKIQKSQIKTLAKEYKDFPMINSLHAFSDIARDSVAILIISYFFNSAILGYYALTIRLLKTPLTFIGSAIGQVFLKQATEYVNEGRLFEQVKKLLARLIILGIPMFIILFFGAEELFKLIFGKQWSDAGLYTKILTPLFLLNFLCSPLSILPLILNKQKTYFMINLTSSICFIMVFWICGLNKLPIQDTLIYLSIIASIFYAINLFWLISITKSK